MLVGVMLARLSAGVAMAYAIGIDVGTTNVRVVLVSSDGELERPPPRRSELWRLHDLCRRQLAGEPLLCLGDDFPATDLEVA
jgi:predicted NBD/HSP70 family sugar kinase